MHNEYVHFWYLIRYQKVNKHDFWTPTNNSQTVSKSFLQDLQEHSLGLFLVTSHHCPQFVVVGLTGTVGWWILVYFLAV